MLGLKAKTRKDEPNYTNEYTSPKLAKKCLVDRSQTAEAKRSGYGWVWRDGSGNEQLLELKNKENSMSSLHSEMESLL